MLDTSRNLRGMHRQGQTRDSGLVGFVGQSAFANAVVLVNIVPFAIVVFRGAKGDTYLADDVQPLGPSSIHPSTDFQYRSTSAWSSW